MYAPSTDDSIYSLVGPKPQGLGLEELLVFDDNKTFYHLKGILSEEEKKGLLESAKAVTTYNLGRESTHAYGDARLSKSTLLRLSILLRNPSSTSIFPNLERVTIWQPIKFNILPFLLGSEIISVRVNDWDYTNRISDNSEPCNMVLENDLIQYLKTLANTAHKMSYLHISESVSPRLLDCVPAFTNLRELCLRDIKLSGQPDMVECIFEVTRKLPKLEDLTLILREMDAIIVLNNAPPRPYQLTLKYAALLLTDPGYKAFGQYFTLTVKNLAQFTVLAEAADRTPASEPPATSSTEVISHFISQSPPPSLALRGSSVGVPTPPPIPGRLLKELLSGRAPGALLLDDWTLDGDQISQTLSDAAIECKAQPASLQHRRLEHLEILADCRWQGLSLRTLIPLAIVYPRLQRLESAIRLEPPSFPSGWDTSLLEGAAETSLTELIVLDPNPNETGPSLDIQDLVAITKYLKKVFPKLKTITCKTKQEGWSLVKELLEMATSR